MYDIFTYIYHKDYITIHVGKYTNRMDPIKGNQWLLSPDGRVKSIAREDQPVLLQLPLQDNVFCST